MADEFLSQQTFSAASNGGDMYVEVSGNPRRTSITGTDGIIESGSNANGEYVKLADGTLMCWQTFSTETLDAGNQSPSRTWTFPEAFTSAPKVFFDATSSFTADTGASPEGIGASSTGYVVYNTGTINAQNSVAITPDGFAIGKWA